MADYDVEVRNTGCDLINNFEGKIPEFKRINNDLFYLKTITLLEALWYGIKYKTYG